MGIAPVPCVIDTDPGVDDVLAILLALSSPELLILSFTLTHGNTPLPLAYLNLQKLFYALELHLTAFPDQISRWPGLNESLRKKLGLGKILVGMGEEGPIDGQAVTAKYFHGLDGLSNISTRHPDLSPPPTHTSPFYTLSPLTVPLLLPDLISTYPPSTVAYLALGPLTSLAKLHQSSPGLLDQFSVIFAMGGAVDCPGNITPVSEFNIYADPYAASQILSLSLPHFHLLPLDITTPHTLPFPLYTSLVDPHFSSPSSPSLPSKKSPLVHFTSSFLEGTREVMAGFGGGDHMEMHDPTVVWALVDWSKGGKEKEKEGGGGGKERERELEGLFGKDVELEVRERFLTSSTTTTTSEVIVGEENNFTTTIVSTTVSTQTGTSRVGSVNSSTNESMRRKIERNGFNRRTLEHRRRSSDLRSFRNGGGGGSDEEEDDDDSTTTGTTDEEEVVSNLVENVEEGGEEEFEGGEEDEDWIDDEFLAEGWEWQWREFEVETTGTLTRGMFVIDRRTSASTLLPTSSKIRSIAVDQQEQQQQVSFTEVEKLQERKGTKCVIATPGGDTLRALLLERIWGVSIGLW